MAALELPPNAARSDLINKHWITSDASDATDACHGAAAVLLALREHDLAWEYLTTPISRRPNEAAPWLTLAQTLQQRGDVELADKALAAAFAAEPTNAQTLWDRAQLLRHCGRSAEARGLLKQLAEGTWQPRFAWLQTQARAYLDEP